MPEGGAGCPCGTSAGRAPLPPPSRTAPLPAYETAEATAVLPAYETADATLALPARAGAATLPPYPYPETPAPSPYGPAPARTAEPAQAFTDALAAAEDFDPLRIRPYVTLDENARPPAEPDTAGPLPPLAATPPPPPGAMPPHARGHRSAHRGQRRPMKAVAFGVAAAAVLSGAAFASGMFSGDAHTDEALADTTHTGLPDEGLPDGSTTGPAQPAARSALSSPDASGPARTSTARTTRAVGPAVGHRAAPAAAHADGSLAPGDSGARVAALQRRLGGMHLYHGSDSGLYGQDLATAVRIYQMYRHVTGDPPGVYGPETRRALESEQIPGASTEHSTGRHSTTQHSGHSGHSGHTGQAVTAYTRESSAGGQPCGADTGRGAYGGDSAERGGNTYGGGHAGTPSGGSSGKSHGGSTGGSHRR
ncbi:peptidoglycan-binding protein [Streptomyces sp. DW26H14]|uniref:peptidoglycan-binding protein n=1 Tax=Streptomyces sp. DW26H14 TaxID=3435395 RepID=UPI00403DEE1D